ncbi:MAG: hypothetical protein M5U08_16175 [Burkholderiales bacterium]|nr:hypothetical protein [Burkholderiales bacterium]
MAGTDPERPQDQKQAPAPERAKGPGGLTMREIHAQAKRGLARDRAAQKVNNPLAQPHSRWQRLVRYVWDRKGGDGRR